MNGAFLQPPLAGIKLPLCRSPEPEPRPRSCRRAPPCPVLPSGCVAAWGSAEAAAPVGDPDTHSSQVTVQPLYPASQLLGKSTDSGLRTWAFFVQILTCQGMTNLCVSASMSTTLGIAVAVTARIFSAGGGNGLKNTSDFWRNKLLH